MAWSVCPIPPCREEEGIAAQLEEDQARWRVQSEEADDEDKGRDKDKGNGE